LIHVQSISDGHDLWEIKLKCRLLVAHKDEAFEQYIDRKAS
jgi:hypothetical protein